MINRLLLRVCSRMFCTITTTHQWLCFMSPPTRVDFMDIRMLIVNHSM